MSSRTLEAEFYQRSDVVEVARDLLGHVLCTRLDGLLTRVLITETEAYEGVTDRACHAYGGRRTRRTEPMFHTGGIAYVYLCYGIHHLFNVVTATDGVPHAVLVRAGAPLTGTAHMLSRRGKAAVDKNLLAGPGSLARALGITTGMSGLDLQGRPVWIEEAEAPFEHPGITCRPRVGVDYAGVDAMLPWRFSIEPQL